MFKLNFHFLWSLQLSLNHICPLPWFWGLFVTLYVKHLKCQQVQIWLLQMFYTQVVLYIIDLIKWHSGLQIGSLVWTWQEKQHYFDCKPQLLHINMVRCQWFALAQHSSRVTSAVKKKTNMLADEVYTKALAPVNQTDLTERIKERRCSWHAPVTR